MKNQQLIDDWQSALNYKQEIINNCKMYYSEEEHCKVYKDRYISCFGWHEKRREYYTERIFNQQKYDEDLAAADQKINDCAIKVESLIKEYRNNLQQAIRNKDATIKEINNDISNLINNSNKFYRENNELKKQVQNECYKITELKQKLDSIPGKLQTVTKQNQILENKVNQMEEGIQKLTQLHSALDKVTGQKNQLQTQVTTAAKRVETNKQQLNERDTQIFEAISKATLLQRTDIFANSFILFSDQPSQKEKYLSFINSLGFDINYLAYIAVEKDNLDLLSFAIDHGADCICYSTDINKKGTNVTLLQKAVHENKEQLVNKILVSSAELDTVLCNAIIQTDLKTLDKIFSFNKSYLHKFIHGYSPLHIALSCSNNAVVDKILSLDSTCEEDLTCSKETTFKIALRGSNTELARKFGAKANIKEEIIKIIKDHETNLFEKALGFCNASLEIERELLTHALANNEMEIAAKLYNKDDGIANLEAIFQQAKDEHNDQILQNIIALDNNYLDQDPYNENIEENQINVGGELLFHIDN